MFYIWLSFRWCPFAWLVHWHICASLVVPWDCSSRDSICFWLNVVYFWCLNTGAYPGGCFVCLFVFHTTSCMLGLRLSKYPEMISTWIIRFLTDKCQHSSGTGETSFHLPKPVIFLPSGRRDTGLPCFQTPSALSHKYLLYISKSWSHPSPLTFWATLICLQFVDLPSFPAGPPWNPRRCLSCRLLSCCPLW